MTTHSRFYSNMITYVLMLSDASYFAINPLLFDCRQKVNDIVMNAMRNEKENKTRFYRIYHEITNECAKVFNVGKDIEYLYYVRILNDLNKCIWNDLYKFREDTK